MLRASMIRLLAIAAVGAALVVAGCGGDDDGESANGEAGAAAEEATTTTEETEAEERDGAQEHDEGRTERQRPRGTEITTADSQFGEVLFDADDQAIYYFDVETTSESECYGECAEAWPPVLTDGEPQATGGARQGLLGTTERDDGAIQVTYDGRPLYYYRDEGPGELRCHDVFHLGGTWLAVQPGGAPVPT